MMSMRRKIAGLKPSEIRNLGREELDLPVTKQVMCWKLLIRIEQRRNIFKNSKNNLLSR
jgi:hypothetical protein